MTRAIVGKPEDHGQTLYVYDVRDDDGKLYRHTHVADRTGRILCGHVAPAPVQVTGTTGVPR